MTAEKPEFRDRPECVQCGSTDRAVIWEGAFEDDFVRRNIEADRYSADVPTLLAGQRFSRVRCNACGISFHARILTDRWLGVLYSQWIDDAQIEAFEAEARASESASEFERGRQSLKNCLRIRHLLEAGRRDHPRLLDYGCGDGAFLAAASVLAFEGLGVDFSVTRAERSARRGISVYGSLEMLDAASPAPIDAATLFEVLEHVAEPMQLLESLAARLRPGGVLLVEVPDCRGIEVPASRNEFHAVHPLEHINHFTPDTLRQMCERAGFTARHRVPAHITTHPTDLLKTEVSRFVHPPRTSQFFVKS